MVFRINSSCHATTSGDDSGKQRLLRGESENAEKKTSTIWGRSSDVAERVVMEDMIAVDEYKNVN